MISNSYVVEQLEGSSWVPKLVTNFEDSSFPEVAKALKYRILHNGVDITAAYRDGTSDKKAVAAASKEPAMKPAAYKALSEEDKKLLQDKATKLREAKRKRTEILVELNISEATYDAMRADMNNSNISASSSNIVTGSEDSSNTQTTVSPQSTITEKQNGASITSVKRAGLLGRR